MTYQTHIVLFIYIYKVIVIRYYFHQTLTNYEFWQARNRTMKRRCTNSDFQIVAQFSGSTWTQREGEPFPTAARDTASVRGAPQWLNNGLTELSCAELSSESSVSGLLAALNARRIRRPSPGELAEAAQGVTSEEHRDLLAFCLLTESPLHRAVWRGEREVPPPAPRGKWRPWNERHSGDEPVCFMRFVGGFAPGSRQQRSWNVVVALPSRAPGTPQRSSAANLKPS